MRAILLVTILLPALAAPVARADLCREPVDILCIHEHEGSPHECLVFAGWYASPYVCYANTGQADGVCSHTRLCEDVKNILHGPTGSLLP